MSKASSTSLDSGSTSFWAKLFCTDWTINAACLLELLMRMVFWTMAKAVPLPKTFNATTAGCVSTAKAGAVRLGASICAGALKPPAR